MAEGRNALELSPTQAATVIRARRLDARYRRLAEVARETSAYLDRLAKAFEPPVDEARAHTLRGLEEAAADRLARLQEQAHEALRTINFAGLYRDRLLEVLEVEEEET